MKSHLQVDDWQESDPANANWLVVGVGTVFWIADRNAAREFWEVYARVRGYDLGGRTRLPESTPLLREGTASDAGAEDFTIATAELPECAPYIPELYAQARRGPRPLGKFGDAFRRGKRPVILESEALGERFEILVGEGQEEVWTHRLFTPADHKEDAEDLDALAAATGTIARRLLEESAQTSQGAR